MYQAWFPKIFFSLLFALLPIGILISYLSTTLNEEAFTFVNCWLLALFFTLSFIQHTIIYKNGLCKYILSKTELDYWNEPKFVKILWMIRIGFLVGNLSLTIYYGISVWAGAISESVLSIFIYLSIVMLINLIFILIIFQFIIPVTNKQMLTIKERIRKFQKLQDNVSIPISFAFMNALLGVQMLGSESHIYQGIVASQNYQKFMIDVEERQRDLLQVARSRSDKLTHDASEFITHLTKRLKDKKERQMNISRVSNPGLSPFDILVSYISFFLIYCLGFPIFIYFALLFQQESTQEVLPLLYFAYPLGLLLWKRGCLLFFSLKSFFDYNYEGKMCIFGVCAYRIAAMSVQSLSPDQFTNLQLIKFSCKFIGFWIEVYCYQLSLEQRKNLYMSFIRGSIVDQTENKNKLSTKPTIEIQRQTTTRTRRQSTYEAAGDTPSFSKTVANWQNVEAIDNIKQSLLTKQVYSFIILQASELIFQLLFLILSTILYKQSEQNGKWDTFEMTPERHTTFQTQVGIELLFDCLFTFLSYLLYKTVKMPINYSLTGQLAEIVGADGLKSLVYDFGFALVVCFLVVGNKFEVK